MIYQCISGETHFKHQKSLGESSVVKKFRIRIFPSMASGVAVVIPDLLKVAPEFRYTMVIIWNNLSFWADHSRMTWWLFRVIWYQIFVTRFIEHIQWYRCILGMMRRPQIRTVYHMPIWGYHLLYSSQGSPRVSKDMENRDGLHQSGSNEIPLHSWFSRFISMVWAICSFDT